MKVPTTKLAQLKACMAAGDEIGALRIAAKFPTLGEHRERIQRAWSAFNKPEFYRGMGYDPATLIADGIAAIRERYSIEGQQ